MFDKLFKNKIEHPDPDKRMEAIKSLTSNDDDVALLSSLILNESDKNVRIQALKHLLEILTEDSNLDSSTAAQLFNLAEATHRDRLIEHIKDNKILHSLIANSDDEEILIICASKAVSPHARKQAVEKINNPESLKKIQQQVNDKNVLQIVRRKLADIKQRQRSEQALRQTLTQICEAVERLANAEFEPMMINRLNILQTRWDQAEDRFKKEFSERYTRATGKCHALINDAKQRAAMEEFEHAQKQLSQSICESFENKIHELCEDNLKFWDKEKQELEQQWNAVTKHVKPDVEISEKFYSIKSAAEKIDALVLKYNDKIAGNDIQSLKSIDLGALDELESHYFEIKKELNWPFSIQCPVLFEQFAAQHNEIKNVLKTRQKEIKTKQATVDKKIAVLKSHIRQKNLIKANRLFNYIQNLINELPESLKLKEQHKLQSVINSLNELRDLNEFITRPKKEELCTQMESLIQVKLSPQKLMDQIKGLQDKWKSLATSDTHADDVLWERFKLASDKAFLPCAEYLNKLEKQKLQNLESRKRLSQKLEQTLAEIDWQHIDWKQLQKTYNHYWKEWRSLSPVFFSQNKPVQKQFDARMQRIKQRLDVEKNENHQIYDQIIEVAIQLVDSMDDDNLEQTVQQVKCLQAKWKNVGIIHFNKSRKQWKKFSGLCDQIYERQRGKQQAKLAGQNLKADLAYKLIKQIRQLVNIPDENLIASQEDYRLKVEQFQAIENLPVNRQEKIQRQFEQACEQYQSHLSGLGQRNRLRSHRIARQAAQLCCKAEQLAMSQGKKAEFEQLKTEFNTLEFTDELCEALNNRMKRAAEHAEQQTVFADDELASNEASLSLLIIQLEVMFDIESPEYAKSQRMAYQLEQLQSGLKPILTQQQKSEQLVKLELQWYATGAVKTPARNALEDRLAAVIKQAET